jgi:hypothetical protein
MSNEKVRISTFIDPVVAREMKVYAAQMGWRGLTECIEKAWASHKVRLSHVPEARPARSPLETYNEEAI